MSSLDSPAALSEIGQIALTMADVPRATGFYRDVLGLKFLFAAGPTLSFFAAGSVRLMLTTPQGAGEAVWLAAVRDPEGNTIELMSEV